MSPRTPFRAVLAPIALGAAMLGACAHASSRDVSAGPTVGARIAPSEMPVQPGDCAEALRRAADKPDLVVDRLPTPVVTRPAVLKNVPRSALRKDGSASVKVDVLIDTLGRADMKTFKVVAASHPWLVKNVRTALAKWKFEPAELAGCKVPRVYHFMASAPARGSSSKSDR